MSTFETKSPSRSRPSVPRWMVLFAACVAAGGAARAGTPVGITGDGDALQRVVKYSAGSLGTESGARQLYARLVRAAEDVCPGDVDGRRFLNASIRACRRQAIENAVRAIGSPRLAAVHASRSGHG